MSDDQTTAPPPMPVRQVRRRRRKRRASPAAVRREFKEAAAAVDKPTSGFKPLEISELDKVMAASGLLAANLPEAPVLGETAEETKAKLTRQEKDQLSLAAAPSPGT